MASTCEDRSPGTASTLRRGVQGISFPRSGHNLLAQFLMRYFGDEFHYCTFFRDCRRRPCTHPGNHYQKGHDFDLQLPPEDSEFHLLQYRHPLYSIPSHFEFEVQHSRATGDALEDTPESWRAFATGQIGHWKLWIRKWVLSGPVPGALPLPYEDVVRDPAAILGAAVTFWRPSEPVDTDRVDAAINDLVVGPRRKLARFRYFDRGFFRGLEDSVREELGALGYGRVMGRWGRPPMVAARTATEAVAAPRRPASRTR